MMSKMMSNLMSEFREKIAVQFAYIGCRNVRAIRSIDVVGYAAPAGVYHINESVLCSWNMPFLYLRSFSFIFLLILIEEIQTT